MAQIETWLNCDLQKPAPVLYPEGRLFSQDNNGNLIGVRVTSGGQSVSLSGSTVNGYCILSTGETVPVSGSISGNAASIVLPEAAYSVPGLINIIIKLKTGSDVVTIGAVVSTVFGIGNVVNPSQSTIDEWERQINATITALENGAVRYDASQSLTTEQKAQARTNIGASTAATQLTTDDYRIVIP